MKPIIRVENLSKKYKLGESKQPYSTLRESLVETLKSPFKSFQKSDEESSFWALKDINFEIFPGEVVGIIGRNGAGKSTLLKVLSRITEPTNGKIELYGRVASLLEVGTGFHPELTGRENIFLNGAILGMKRSEIVRKFDEIVDFAEVEKFIDTPVKRYSSGMYVRLAFAVASSLEPEILIVDEVLAVGDADFQKKCIGKMKDVSESGRTVLFVSHNMNSISNLCSKCVLLQSGRIIYQGETSKVIQKYLTVSKNWEMEFEKEVIKYASIKQRDNLIEINAKFIHDKPIKNPKFGFVIRDKYGYPVCGTNSQFDFEQDQSFEGNAGQYKIIIKQPKLQNGNYKLTLGFSDATTVYFWKQDFLSFDIINMTEKHNDSVETYGSSYPECSWELTSKN